MIPKNTLPTSTLTSVNEQYIVQLDSTVGQEFSWAMTKETFIDGNIAPTVVGVAQYDSTYAATSLNNEDHTVWLQYTNPLISTFDQVS